MLHDDAVAGTGLGPALFPVPNEPLLVQPDSKLDVDSDNNPGHPPGQILTGKQEHYLKRELISQQVQKEMGELASPLALQRFGSPFRSDAGEISPQHSEFPIFRYVFVNHIRKFPFIDQVKEKEFWQDKLQVFLESFANKRISTSEDRLEITKRRKLALKAEKVLELMMVSGLGTASGYEETINFSEIEVVDRSANDHSIVANSPTGHAIHGWDVNIATVRMESLRHHIRYHTHSNYILTVKHDDGPEIYISRRYTDFSILRKKLQLEFPAKVLPTLPKKNNTDHSVAGLLDDEGSESSIFSRDSVSIHDGKRTLENRLSVNAVNGRPSISSFNSQSSRVSNKSAPPRVLAREQQRVSLRAFLRVLLQNERYAQSRTMSDFLTTNPITPTDGDLEDARLRKRMDEKRLKEHQRFYETARKQAAELDREMEQFRRSVVHGDGLENLFTALKEKNSIAELDPVHKTFAKWLGLEVAATLYHIFLAEDNSPEIFAQAKQVHKYIPYSVLSTIIRFASPATVMNGVVNLFLQRRFGMRSLFEKIIEYALGGGITTIDANLTTLKEKIRDAAICERITNFINAPEEVKAVIRAVAEDDGVDLLVTVARVESGLLSPELSTEQVLRVRKAYDSWNRAVERVDADEKQDVELFAQLKQFFKQSVRLRDKQMMLSLIRDEPTTIPLFQDLFRIFYNPLVLVYKSANVYNSIHDFARFADDTIKVVEGAQNTGLSADPNQTVQTFINLCETHQDNFYKFLHEIYKNDSDLFTNLRIWFEGILNFLRNGPKSQLKLDMNGLVQRAVDSGLVDKDVVLAEVNSLIKWQLDRKRWHQNKTKQKMAADRALGSPGSMSGDEGDDRPISPIGALISDMGAGLTVSDFGLDQTGVDDLAFDEEHEYSDSSSIDAEEDTDPIGAERRRRQRHRERLRRTAGEPQKPVIVELGKMGPEFVLMLRDVFAE